MEDLKKDFGMFMILKECEKNRDLVQKDTTEKIGNFAGTFKMKIDSHEGKIESLRTDVNKMYKEFNSLTNEVSKRLHAVLARLNSYAQDLTTMKERQDIHEKHMVRFRNQLLSKADVMELIQSTLDKPKEDVVFDRASIETLNISIRHMNCLINAGYKFVGELEKIAYTDDIYKIKGFGIRGINSLRKALNEQKVNEILKEKE